jgi:putative ATPase
MRDLNYGKDYQYAHDIEGKVAGMDCLPESLRDRRYYHPTRSSCEKRTSCSIWIDGSRLS